MLHWLNFITLNSRFGKFGRKQAMRTIEEIQADVDETRREWHDAESEERKDFLRLRFNQLLAEREDAEQAARNALPAGEEFSPIIEEVGGVVLDTFSDLSTEEKLENLNSRLMHVEGFLRVFSKNDFSSLDNIISSAMIQEFQNGSGFEQGLETNDRNDPNPREGSEDFEGRAQAQDGG